jgi:putative SOS response-associated peptidase YedK
MCGRARLVASGDDLAEIFGVDIGRVAPFQPRRNLAPTDPFVCVVRSGDGARSIVTKRWGMLPPKTSRGTGYFNARVETAATNGMFRSSFERRRCAMVADGFYEWLAEGKKKVPRLFTAGPGGRPFAMAGIYRDDACAVITRPAIGVTSEVHDRMPVILAPEDIGLWLAEETRIDVLMEVVRRGLTDLDVEVIDRVPLDAPPKARRQIDMFHEAPGAEARAQGARPHGRP